jgi:hypothetical protein
VTGRLAPIAHPETGEMLQPVARGAFADACLIKWFELDGTDKRFLKGSGISVPVEIYRQIEGPARNLVEHWARRRGAFKPGFVRPAKSANRRGR